MPRVPEPYLLGYARVSKGDDQSNAAQLTALKRAGCARLFEEAASGGRWDRSVLQELMRQLRPGDVVVVWEARPTVALAQGPAAPHGADRSRGRRLP